MDNSGVPFVTINRMVELSGYSEAAIRTKTQSGEWAEGREWIWAPDGRKLISLDGYRAWCLRGGKPSKRGHHKGEQS